ncbi:UNKNOWN [Stylonychia lemnae]|uniref:EamA domain-containing protein n=1 Tax=Stylonychia lemnae TaxID=5949 RepID=A0A078AHR0_STYLE|nr:UNKNOWN [Stylonychia lemnae]|eukprot:CDW81401.1 UNKNOWN [Stylonychia lemnae]
MTLNSTQDLTYQNDLSEPLLVKDQLNEISQKPRTYETSRVAQLFKKYYLYAAIFIGLCYGLFNYVIFIAVNGVMELRTIYLITVINFMFFIIYHLICAIQLKIQKGSFWKLEDSAYYDQKGRFDLKLGSIVIIRSCFQLLSQFILYYILQTSIMSGINASIVFSIYAATSVMVAIAFYLLFKESLGLKHIIGIVLVMVSVILIANGKYAPAEDVAVRLGINEENRISVFIPIALALANCCIFVMSSVMARLIRTTKISTLQYTTDSQALVSTVLTSMAIYEHFYVKPYAFYEFSLVSICSLLYLMGAVVFTGAVTYGKGGTTQAIMQIQAPFQLALEIIFLSIYPQFLGFLGMVVCIVGALIIILGKH